MPAPLSAIGMVVKLSATALTMSKCPSRLKNTSIVIKIKNCVNAVLWPCVLGSKKLAKPKPMVMPIICPAISMAASTTRCV